MDLLERAASCATRPAPGEPPDRRRLDGRRDNCSARTTGGCGFSWWLRLRRAGLCRRRARGCRPAGDGRAVVAARQRSDRIRSSPRPGSPPRSKRISAASHQVEVGGTQLERDANGRTALRIRDIVVRDPDGTIVASAPKAEVGVSSSGLMTGRVRAERLSLVGAEMQVRIEPDSKVTVFAGANKRPFVTASAASTPPGATPDSLRRCRARPAGRPVPAARCWPARNLMPDFAALLAWIDGLGATGLDGHDLSELGLKNGNLTVDDQRNGKQWTFQDINLSLTRPKAGGVALTLSSEAAERPWLLRAAMTPGEHGHRIVDIETQKLPARDLMLAMRLGDGQYEPDMPVSARIRADIGPDGIPQMVDGRIVVDKGLHHRHRRPAQPRSPSIAPNSISIGTRRARPWSVPFQVVSGGNRFTLVRPARRAARGRRRLGLEGYRRHRRARHRGERSEPARPQPLPAAAARRSRQAAHRCRAGRPRQHGRRPRDLRRARLLDAASRGSPSGSPATACRSRP